MDWQNALVLVLVAAAAFYVARALWPRRRADKGCANCDASPQRRDDYVQ
jgi:hypothetical protein